MSKVRILQGSLKASQKCEAFLLYKTFINKNGFSKSLRKKRGSYNIFKPNYSSFKMGGVQIRGKNAATFQMIYMIIILCVNFIKFFWYASISILWFTFLTAKWFLDFIIGFVKGFNSKE